MTKLERVMLNQILLNQIAIMAGLKALAVHTHGYGPGAAVIDRYDKAIETTAEILRGEAG